MNNDEILFETTIRNAETFEGYTLRLYNSGLYQKITYSASDSLENSEQKIETIGENPKAVAKVKELFRHNQAIGLEAYINDYDEIKINNPYASSELTYVRFREVTASGKNLFTVFPEDELKKLNLNSTKEEKSAYRKIRTISRLKTETVILLRQMFEMEETHITEKGKCVICGEPYENYGFATWGYWNEPPSEYYLGEDKRCCKTCYEQKVMPERAKKSRLEMENNQKEDQ